jgi:hypothetical protein
MGCTPQHVFFFGLAWHGGRVFTMYPNFACFACPNISHSAFYLKYTDFHFRSLFSRCTSLFLPSHPCTPVRNLVMPSISESWVMLTVSSSTLVQSFVCASMWGLLGMFKLLVQFSSWVNPLVTSNLIVYVVTIFMGFTLILTFICIHCKNHINFSITFLPRPHESTFIVATLSCALEIEISFLHIIQVGKQSFLVLYLFLNSVLAIRMP